MSGQLREIRAVEGDPDVVLVFHRLGGLRFEYCL